ncbi:cytochrome P450 [Rhizodiscina lignyota]|uniref:Cytochrome P450 n=1 Tax=Rhizodiscina lignyota TaxID=1504668 RepID=A0A9P4I4U2_9PEZI|nr:cytochrome P450 [Rhizodiscina lignyota]
MDVGWIAAIVIILPLINAIYNLYLHPLANVPGPFFARISRLWLIHKYHRGNFQHAALDLHKRYGPVVRISPNEVSVWSASSLKTVYGAGSGFVKADWYWITRSDDTPDGLDFLGEMNDEKRRLQRRIVGPVYSTASVQKYEDSVNRVLVDLEENLRTGNGQGLDIDIKLHAFMCDALAEVSFSDRPGYIKDGHDHGAIRGHDLVWKYYSVIGLSKIGTYISQKLKALRPLVCYAFLIKPPHQSHLSKWLGAHAQARIDDANKAPEDDPRNDMAKDLILLHHRRPNWRLLWSKNMLLTNLGAGHDTTLVSMLSFFANVGTNPDIKARLVAELDGANLSDPPKYSEVAVLPYFDACLKEAMRIIPVIWVQLGRKVPRRGTTVDGYYLPGGTTVGCCPYVAHRNPDVYGADAETYNPDRWLVGDAEHVRAMQRALLIWGGPSRSCPGQYLAQFILLKMLATVFTKYDVEVEWDKSAFTPAAFLSKLEGVGVWFHPR